MITLFRSNENFSNKDTKQFMLRQIRHLSKNIEVIGILNKVLRLEVFCQPLHILSWLSQQNSEKKIYWSSRDEEFEMGGVGAADCLKGDGPVDYQELFSYFEERLSDNNPRLRYYGGVGFNPKGFNQEWQSFGTYQFLIPRFEIIRHNSQWIFALNILLEDIQNEKTVNKITHELEEISFEPQDLNGHSHLGSPLKDLPTQEIWEDIFLKVKNYIKKDVFKKIVLAKKSIYNFSKNINPFSVLNTLKERSPSCYHFCFIPAPRQAFLGASPERLYKRNGRLIETEAIAGTKSRGKTPEDDEKNKKELLSSSKDTQEHNFVVEFIKGNLNEICTQMEYDENFNLLEHNAGHHLITKFKGVLKSKIYDDSIFSALHPTPAVGGFPKSKVLDLIGTLEPFERGWYAGVIGYVGYDLVELSVAIRSGLILDKTLNLYAGAGIVDESTSQGEWEEIEQKIRSFLEIFK